MPTGPQEFEGESKVKLWHAYVGIGLAGLLATGSQAWGYLAAGPVGGTIDFWKDALASNDAARFMTFDVAFLGIAIFLLMWVEGRRVGISAPWFVFYAVGSVVVGISTFVPFFFAHRQWRLDRPA